MSEEADAIRQREQGRATVRALYLSQLHDIRHRRGSALQEAEAQLDRLARLLPSATDAGLTISEIAKAAQVSRPTVYQLRARFSHNSYDLRLALLQTIANLGRVNRGLLEDLIQSEAAEVKPTLDGLVEEGIVDEDFNDDPELPDMAYALTAAGLDELERWDFRPPHDEDEASD